MRARLGAKRYFLLAELKQIIHDPYESATCSPLKEMQEKKFFKFKGYVKIYSLFFPKQTNFLNRFNSLLLLF